MEEGSISTAYPELFRAAEVAIKDVICLRPGERVLIVTNPNRDVNTISRALYEVSSSITDDCNLLVQSVRSQLDLASEEVMGAIRTDPDVILSISHEKLGKDEEAIRNPIRIGDRVYDHYFNYLLGEKKSRSFWSPSVTLDMFQRCVDIDYRRLKEDCELVKGVLDGGTSARLTSPLGTDLTIGLEGMAAKQDDGDFSRPGAGGNIPAGETFISPELGSSNGVIIFDGSIASDRGVIILESPISCRVEGGYVTEISGGKEAEELKGTIKRAIERTNEWAREGRIPPDQLDAYVRNCRNLGELGVGLNRKARIVGNMLEDEKVYGTCHIAIGSNYDNDANALIHLDGLIRSPTLTVTGRGFERELMKNGELSAP